MRVLAALLALGAIVCMVLAIVGMVIRGPFDRAGLWLRIGGVVLFGAAVAVNVAAH